MTKSKLELFMKMLWMTSLISVMLMLVFLIFLLVRKYDGAIEERDKLISILKRYNYTDKVLFDDKVSVLQNLDKDGCAVIELKKYLNYHPFNGLGYSQYGYQICFIDNRIVSILHISPNFGVDSKFKTC